MLVSQACLCAAGGYDDIEGTNTQPGRFITGYRSWSQMLVRLVIAAVLLIVLDLIWFQLARVLGVDYFGTVEASCLDWIYATDARVYRLGKMVVRLCSFQSCY